MKRWVWLLAGLNVVSAAQVSDFRLQQTLPLFGSGQYIQALAFSPDDRQLLVVDEDPLSSTLMLWDIKNSVPLWRKKVAIPGGYTRRATFIDADRIRVELGTLEGLEFSAKTGAPLTTIHNLYPALDVHPDWIHSIAVYGNLLAYTLKEGLVPPSDPSEVRLVSLETGQEVGRLKEFHGGVERLAFSPDGRTLAVARSDQRVSLWDVQTRTKLRNLRGVHPDATDTTWMGLNQHFVVSQVSHRGLHVWDAQSGQLLYRSLDQPFVRAAALNHAGDSVAQSLELGAIHLLDLSSRTVKTRLGFPVQQVVSSKDGRSLWVLSGDSRIRLYQKDGAGQYGLNEEHILDVPVLQMVWLESGQVLLSVQAMDNYALYDLKTRTLSSFRIGGGDNSERMIPLDTERVLLGVYGIIDVRAKTFTHQMSLPQPECDGNVQLSPDLKQQTCLGPDKQLRLRNLDGKVVWQQHWPVENPSLFYWSPSRSRIATTWLKGQITVLNAKTGKSQAILKVKPPQQEDMPFYPTQMLFSPDEKLLVAQYADGRFHYFDLTVRRELAMPPELARAAAVQFTPDGRLVSQDMEGLHFWSIPAVKVFVP